MKIYYLLINILFLLYSCTTSKPIASDNKEAIVTSVKDLQSYTKNNCRFNDFKIGKYADSYSYEKFGLDTLKGKYIWYINKEEKIIVNTFLKEKFAVKYAYYQINKEFPKLKGAFTITTKSKKVEQELLSDFKKNNIKFEKLVSFNDELGYSAEIEISKCYSRKAESVLVNYPDVNVTYN